MVASFIGVEHHFQQMNMLVIMYNMVTSFIGV